MAATKRKVVEKSKVGEKVEEPKVEENAVAEVPSEVPSEEPTDIEQTTTASSNVDGSIFVKLSDGVMVDLMEIQAYVHEEGAMGRVFLKGGNNFPTPCGDELVKRIRQCRMFNS